MVPQDAIQAMEFAQSKGQARQEGMTGVKFEDVAGMGYIQDELQDIVSVCPAGRPALLLLDIVSLLACQ